MDVLAPPLAVRAWKAWRAKGGRYLWHKTLRRTLGRWPAWKRRLLYADPREYWTLRGGDEYFREQEGQELREARSDWIARRVAAYRPSSILEVGCGYGKQLRKLRRALPDCRIVGVDFSPSQLTRGRDYLDEREAASVSLALADGRRLPFADHSFDLVLTSAVILHNPPEVAERIRLEVVRVSRRWAVHNEDTDVSYNRYGYDTVGWYRDRGIAILEAAPFPREGPPSQFCVAEPWRP